MTEKKENEKEKTRSCPRCGKPIIYIHRCSMLRAEKEKSICRSCATTEMASKRDYRGNKNPFFGKHLSEETKEKLRRINTGRKDSEETKKKRSAATKGENNPRWKRPLMLIWTEKYGEKEALRKEDLWKKRMSRRTKGEGNPMYGKPSPQGSGNGWSGWYKDWYFRSLRELSFMVKIIEGKGMKWKSADKAKYRISYTDCLGNKRTYAADFIVKGKNAIYLVEIKPKKLHETPGVLAKKKAAEQWCKERGWIYKLTDCSKLTYDEIKELWDAGDIKFLKRYEDKFLDRKNKYS